MSGWYRRIAGIRNALFSPSFDAPTSPDTPEGRQESLQRLAQERDWKLRERECALKERQADDDAFFKRRELIAKEQQDKEDLKLRREQLTLDRDIKDRETKIQENDKRGFWNLAGKALGPATPLLVALIPPTFAFVTFVRTDAATKDKQILAPQIAERTRSATAIYETRKAFAAKQEQAYQQALTTVGVLISSPPNSASSKAARAEFERLYWAQLPLVEDNHVEAAMVDLRQALGANPPDQETLQQKALELSGAVRDSLADTNATVNKAIAAIPSDPAPKPP